MTYVIVTKIAGTTRVYGTWYTREDAEEYAAGVFGKYEVVELTGA